MSMTIVRTESFLRKSGNLVCAQDCQKMFYERHDFLPIIWTFWSTFYPCLDLFKPTHMGGTLCLYQK